MDHWKKIVRAARGLAWITGGIVVWMASTSSTPPAADGLEADLSRVQNLSRPFPWLLAGGQPDSAALAALARAGIHDVFDLRGPDEPRGFDERGVARSLGLRYLAIPTRVDDFRDSRFTAFRHHLIAHGTGKPMFIHCASGNRVGAALLPWLVLDQGLSDDMALEMAHAMGLRDAALTQRAFDYIRSHTPRGE